MAEAARGRGLECSVSISPLLVRLRRAVDQGVPAESADVPAPEIEGFAPHPVLEPDTPRAPEMPPSAPLRLRRDGGRPLRTEGAHLLRLQHVVALPSTPNLSSPVTEADLNRKATLNALLRIDLYVLHKNGLALSVMADFDEGIAARPLHRAERFDDPRALLDYLVAFDPALSIAAPGIDATEAQSHGATLRAAYRDLVAKAGLNLQATGVLH